MAPLIPVDIVRDDVFGVRVVPEDDYLILSLIRRGRLGQGVLSLSDHAKVFDLKGIFEPKKSEMLARTRNVFEKVKFLELEVTILHEGV